ncbi:MAG: hypothetical protein AB6733_20355 [Clostridiaceae bacterium]
MSFYENYFNSMTLFIFTIPTILVILTALLQTIIRNKIIVISIGFILQVILYYGYSCIIVHMKVMDVGLDYIKYITIISLVFGFIGATIGNLILLIKRKSKKRGEV